MIPLFSAERANKDVDLIAPLNRVATSNWYVLGNEVSSFETEFAKYVGVKHCISVANGSDALEIALRGLGVHAGDHVVTVANAGFYGSTAIHAIGAVPLYVDVDDRTLTICPKSLHEALGSRPKAVIATHLYGQLAHIEEIVEMCAKAGVPVLEDCAQAHGARNDAKLAGSFGTIACFSFYPTKNLGAVGDGGAVVTNDSELAQRVKQIRQYGWSSKYTVSVPGGRNSRLDELQAAVLREKLPSLDIWNERRREIAKQYSAAFSSLDVKLPASCGLDFVAHLYVMRTPKRMALMQALKDQEIGSDIHYPIPDHRQPAYREYAGLSLPVTEAACDTAVSLPCFPGMTDEEVSKVIDAVTQFFAQEA